MVAKNYDIVYSLVYIVLFDIKIHLCNFIILILIYSKNRD